MKAKNPNALVVELCCLTAGHFSFPVFYDKTYIIHFLNVCDKYRNGSKNRKENQREGKRLCVWY